jgi:soluble lytic murein transglycosylase-like protein
MLQILLIAGLLTCPVTPPDPVKVAEVVQARGYAFKNPMPVPQAHLVANVAINESGAVPLPLILAVIEIESKWDTKAKSKKNCKGLMQLAKRTAHNLAKKLSMDKHDVFHIPDNVKLGTAYLQEIYQQTGRWDQTLTIYNMGWGNFLKSHKKISGYAWAVLKRAVFFDRLLKKESNLCEKS